MSKQSGNVSFVSAGHLLILKERLRQVFEEGWTLQYDARNHTPEDLEAAAACYAMPPEARGSKMVPHHYDVTLTDVMPVGEVEVPALWPWDGQWWKPGPTRERELVKAGALAAAAIDLRRHLEGNQP